MIYGFFGLFNAFTKHLRNRYFKSEPLVVGAIRSSKWPTVRKHHLEKFPCCAACGNSNLKDLEVHHIIPFSVDATKELDPSNLITLCEASSKCGLKCHFFVGHKKSWVDFNENVRQDSKDMKDLIDRITKD